MKPWTKGLIVALVVLAVALAVMWWREKNATPATPPVQPVVLPVEPAASAVAAPAIEFPLAPAESASQPVFVMPTPENTDAAVQTDLVELAGREGVLTFLQLDGFVRRAVATVDNLDRKHAPARVWPVNPTAGRFTAIGPDGEQVIDADNALRYAPFIQFVESVDMSRAAALYRWMYPMFQRSYEELGYPGRYFNDRLVKVIDHLLQTPVPQQPVAVRLLEIKGPLASERPWVHYQFADPALEQASAGQKILMRMGPVNQRRLQARLAAFRQALVAPPQKR